MLSVNGSLAIALELVVIANTGCPTHMFALLTLILLLRDQSKGPFTPNESEGKRKNVF